MATRKYQNSPLISLPREIRNRIYSYALTSSATLRYRSSALGTTPWTQETGQHDLQATAKLIFKEIYKEGMKAL
jgi:hypothetical protein